MSDRWWRETNPLAHVERELSQCHAVIEELAEVIVKTEKVVIEVVDRGDPRWPALGDALDALPEVCRCLAEWCPAAKVERRTAALLAKVADGMVRESPGLTFVMSERCVLATDARRQLAAAASVSDVIRHPRGYDYHVSFHLKEWNGTVYVETPTHVRLAYEGACGERGPRIFRSVRAACEFVRFGMVLGDWAAAYAIRQA